MNRRAPALNPTLPLFLDLDGKLEESAVGVRRLAHTPRFVGGDARLVSKGDADAVLLERALPDADELTVYDDDVRDERAGARHRRGGSNAPPDRPAIAKADEVFVVIREEQRGCSTASCAAAGGMP